MSERQIGTRVAEGCEACGGHGATVVVPPCGGTAEMCGPCLRDETRQAAIDTYWETH